MTQTNSPYSRPAPMRCICVANRTVHRGTAFAQQEGGEVIITATKTTTTSALSTGGAKVYLAPKSGEEAEFEQGGTFVIKNYSLSLKFGHECIFLGSASSKFKTAPINLPEDARARAEEALCPSSTFKSGDDSDIFTNGYVTLGGYVERLQVVRMTAVKGGEVPILDLHLMTGGKLVEVSLWRDEALVDMRMGDYIEATHLKPNVWPNGRSKMNSTSYTTIKVSERAVKTVEVEVIGLSEEADMFILLDSDYGEYRMPSNLYMGGSKELLGELPMTLIIDHLNFKVVKFSKK